jgi:Domain of unknown function (DUF4279)
MRDFLAFGGDRPDEKSAAFRLVGSRLDPKLITQAIGLAPHMSHRRGDQRELRSGPTRWPKGVWMLRSEEGLPVRGNHLEDHLQWLLDRLHPHAETIRRLCGDQGLTADFWCGYFMGQANSSFGLDEQTLACVAELGASLALDIYSEQAERELAAWVDG